MTLKRTSGNATPREANRRAAESEIRKIVDQQARHDSVPLRAYFLVVLAAIVIAISIWAIFRWIGMF